MSPDELYLQRCLDIAIGGLGNVMPNPMVGCVIVHEGRIIGEGYHRRYGEAHAEMNAIMSVKDKSLLKASTLYVNLEPCNHYGKTPPCTNLILGFGIPRVVIANVDPYPEVAGGGIRRMEEHGVEVLRGVLEAEAHFLNRRFFTFHQMRRPYIILKWAQTADHYIGKAGWTSREVRENWITSEYSRMLVHKWRTEEGAILAGTRTLLQDDPQLAVREWHGSQPLRVAIDKDLSVPSTARVFDDISDTLVFNRKKTGNAGRVSWYQVPEGEDMCDHIMEELYRRRVISMIVEGGAETIQRFVNKGLWDEARVFTGDKAFGEGVKAPSMPGSCRLTMDYGGDGLTMCYNHENPFIHFPTF